MRDQGKLPEILQEDKDIIVCRKPAGLAVQTARPGQPDLVSILKNYRADKQEPPYIGVITRLDQPVEGLLVFAKNRQAAAQLSRQQQSGQWIKEYLAVVRGIPEKKAGRLTDWLRRDGRQNCSAVVPEQTQGAKRAVLSYRVLKVCRESFDGLALVRIRLETGRHHQIRVQMAHAGYPLYGDRKYGPPQELPAGGTLALCAARLTFFHPGTGRETEYRITPEGAGFAAFSERLQSCKITGI
jgi:23S rRNA pseudouridine1911/1915/1917 synthase